MPWSWIPHQRCSTVFCSCRRRHTRWPRDWSSDVCSSDLLIRHTPKMLREVTNFREYVRGSSLRAFPNRFEIQNDAAPGELVPPVTSWLKKRGYAFKVREDEGDSYLVAAKKGGANRLGDRKSVG